MTSRTSMSRRFREMLSSGESFIQPGAFNAQSARMVELAGFKTVCVSGYGVSATLLGKPDVGFATMTEMVQVTGLICDAVKIPVLADADTGYGNAINAMRTVEQYIKAGVGGLFIEDQVAPKGCGHVAGKRVIPVDEAVGKYRATVRARNEVDQDVVLVARCDARGVAGGNIDDVVARGKAFMEAGVDVFFPEGLVSKDELERVAREVKAPLIYNRTGVSPNLTVSELRDLRIFLIINANGAMRAAARAMWDYLDGFAREDAAYDRRVGEQTKNHPLADFHTFVGFPEIHRLEKQFLPAEDVATKYEASIGFRP